MTVMLLPEVAVMLPFKTWPPRKRLLMPRARKLLKTLLRAAPSPREGGTNAL